MPNTQLEPARVRASERESAQSALVLSEPISVHYSKELKRVVSAIKHHAKLDDDVVRAGSVELRELCEHFSELRLHNKLLHHRGADGKLCVYVPALEASGYPDYRALDCSSIAWQDV